LTTSYNFYIFYGNKWIERELILAEFVQIGDSIKDAVVTIMKYIKFATGVEPTQAEVAETLKSYFILNEVGNQIRYQLKKAAESDEQDQIAVTAPFWTFNMMTGPAKNVLARAGYFHTGIRDAIEATREFMKKTSGADPSYEIIARSLKSTFILSEIKNQIDFQRKNARKAKTVN